VVEENFETMRKKGSTFTKPVYVLLYHPWLDGFKECFTTHLSWLRDHHFESVPLENLIQYMKGEEVHIPEHPIAITLDDGTIESYTIAYPLLKEYGFVGTVFAPTANKYIKISGSDWWKGVEAEGVLKIEGHSHTHGLIFINDHVEDFTIKKRQSREPIIKGLDTRSGAPIFGLGDELLSRRFFPNQDLIDRCVDYVKRHGKSTFFKKKYWREELLALISRYPKDRGRYETEEERRGRIEEELVLSKTFIEEALGNGKEVAFFAYPFGAYDVHLIEHVKRTGYRGAFTTDPGGNSKGDDPFLIKRMAISEENSFGGVSNILLSTL
jgi:peptidoglycan/xylan/chitin deacetylase (PgdA/CDA1 family)